MVEYSFNFAKEVGNFKTYADFEDGTKQGFTGNAQLQTSVKFIGSEYAIFYHVDWAALNKNLTGHPQRDDYHMVLLLRLIQDAQNKGIFYRVDGGPGEIHYNIGKSPTQGDVNIAIPLNTWVSLVVPVSADYFNKNASYPTPNQITSDAQSDCRIYLDWIGLFSLADFADEYCRGMRAGMVNNVDSGIRNVSHDDCYLVDTNSDLSFLDDIDLDPTNSKLTIYGTLGDGMRLKVTISWEVGGVPKTDKILYADTLPYAWDLETECPSIDKVTNIKNENILAI